MRTEGYAGQQIQAGRDALAAAPLQLALHSSAQRAPLISIVSAERQQIQAELDALAAEQPEAVRQGFAEPLLLGVASHHAGCLPAWKGLVERLFQRGERLAFLPKC